MRKPVLLAFLGLSCMLGPPPPPPPVAGMSLDPTVKGLAYDSNPGGTWDFDVTIENTGDFAFDWNIFPEDLWLSCTPENGSLLEEESDVVTVTIDFTKVVDGLNAANLRVEWTEGADRYIRVSVYIDGAQGWTIVDGVDGDDAGDGTAANPYKTITKGMEAAVSVYSVVCLPATYDEAVTLGDGLTLVGTGPQGCVIDAGTVTSVVAGAAVSSATTLSGFTITGDNPAVTDGVAMTCEGSPVVTDCEFSSCRGSGHAAVLFKGDSGATLSDCVVKSNSGCYGVGCVDNSFPTISNCEISNSTYSGVLCGVSSSPVIEFCEIASNTYPGIDVIQFALVVIDANTITGNVQGIALWGDSSAIITNNVIMDSTGTAEGAGYGIVSAPGTNAGAFITNNTIVANEEGVRWGSDGGWSLENNIVYHNSTAEVSFNVVPAPFGYNCIQGYQSGDGGTDNTALQPWFENYTDRDLRLKLADVACRNTGNDVATSIPTHDIAGNTRIMGGTVDRGAYEFVE